MTETKNRWVEDTVVMLARETRAKLKMQALLKGITLKEYLKQLAEKNETKS